MASYNRRRVYCSIDSEQLVWVNQLKYQQAAKFLSPITITINRNGHYFCFKYRINQKSRNMV